MALFQEIGWLRHRRIFNPMDHMAVEGFEKNPADAADPLAAALSEAAVSQENTFSETTANRLLDFSKSSTPIKYTIEGRSRLSRITGSKIPIGNSKIMFKRFSTSRLQL